ncbi:MAG: DUF3285 domain-containing protein [Cyanobacteriota bacterium]
MSETNQDTTPLDPAPQDPAPVTTPPPSYVKLAMRNMVRKGRQSLLHFGLTAVGFGAVLLLLAWFARPSVPGA